METLSLNISRSLWDLLNSSFPIFIESVPWFLFHTQIWQLVQSCEQKESNDNNFVLGIHNEIDVPLCG